MPLPLAIPLIAAGAGAIASVIGGRKAQKGAKKEAAAYGGMADQMDQRRAAAAGQAGQTRNMFMEAATAARDFDPSAAIAQQADATMQGLTEQYNQATNARSANLNARGLFGSNIGGARQTRDLNSRIAQAVAGLSMQGAQMRQGAQSDYARTMGQVYGSDVGQENEYLDAAMGLRGTQIGAQAAGDQASAGMWGDIGGSLMGAAGSALPYTRLNPRRLRLAS